MLWLISGPTNHGEVVFLDVSVVVILTVVILLILIPAIWRRSKRAKPLVARDLCRRERPAEHQA